MPHLERVLQKPDLIVQDIQGLDIGSVFLDRGCRVFEQRLNLRIERGDRLG